MVHRGPVSLRRLLAGSSLVLLAALIPSPTSAKTDLRGRALARDGAPLPGASVSIYTARPRQGTSTLCPSCFPDCGKTRRADRAGRFLVRDLSDSLIFRVLVCAPGYDPVFADTVDPKSGPIEVRLRPRDLTRVDLARAIRGRVTDPEGDPVVGATIRPLGFKRGQMQSFGARGTDPLSVTDERGEFLLATAESDAAWFLQVESRGFAPRAFHDVAVGRDDVSLALSHGAIVRGEVWRDGSPLAGAVVGLSSAAMAAGNLIHREEIATDERGWFTFINVAPRAPFRLYGKMESLAPLGALPAHPITTAPDDSTTDVGRLEVVPGHRLGGRVKLTDGKPLPDGVRLTVVREAARDVVQIPLPSDGAFRLEGVPTEVVNLSLRIPGYRLSARTPGYGGYSGVILGVDRDLVDLEILFEPGDDGWNPPSRPAPGG